MSQLQLQGPNNIFCKFFKDYKSSIVTRNSDKDQSFVITKIRAEPEHLYTQKTVYQKERLFKNDIFFFFFFFNMASFYGLY